MLVSNKKIICLTRKHQFTIEADQLLWDFTNTLHLKTIQSVQFNIFYEIENASNTEIEILKEKIFINKITDNEIVFQSWKQHPHLIYKSLPLQFDNRADSAKSIAILLTKNDQIKISTGIILQFNIGLSNSDLLAIKKFVINPLENYEYNFEKAKIIKSKFNNKIINNFEVMKEIELQKMIHDYKLSLDINDLQFIQAFYAKNKQKLNICELQLFNTYWSDHCRHTTFNTVLADIKFTDNYDPTNRMIKETYLQLQKDMQIHMPNKPLTLMNMSKINAYLLKGTAYMNNIEKSDEINACSIGFVANQQQYYLNFKNETHNHPTEISPYGGAATCLGGAIRDILANRAYAFAGIRISGSGNILEEVQDTLPNKLPQRIIAKEASQGFSSYGNQIGLPTAFVHEYYHQGYLAKHLECGAVLGLSSKQHLNKKTPKLNDVIILFGGATGIDGIGGASGSSKEHNQDSINLGSEVQKGNPLIEKKIQRLFRKDTKLARLIKTCNDFGAGGASVAIGEIADSVEIYLDRFATKYSNINPYEILFSESQERMAAVVSPKDVEEFIQLCEKENLNAYAVGKVTDNLRIVVKYHGEILVNVDKQFLDLGGPTKKVHFNIANQKMPTCFHQSVSKNIIETELNSLKNIYDKGLVEQFDSSIGALSILNPMGGKYLLSKETVPLIAIPDVNTSDENHFAAIVGIGFNPELSDHPFYLGYYAVFEALMKIISKGGKLEKTYLSFQEYFPKSKKAHHWANMFLTILGAYKAMRDFNVAAIGGKDSVSGTYEKIEIPNTFIAFAFTVENIAVAIPSTLSNSNTYLYLANISQDKGNFPNINKVKSIIAQYQNILNKGQILSCNVLADKGVFLTLMQSAFGNMKGFNLNYADPLSLKTGALIIESTKPIKDLNWEFLGTRTPNTLINIYDEIASNVKSFEWSFDLITLLNFSLDKLATRNIYLPYCTKSMDQEEILLHEMQTAPKPIPPLNQKQCKVLVAIFPGTNCEFDIQAKFIEQGAIVKEFVFNDLSIEHIKQSVLEFAQLISTSDIITIPGGFSAADEPDGSGKYIASILSEPLVADAIQKHLASKKLILGICNGFQALVQAKLLPGDIYTKVALSKNKINRHVSTIAQVKTIAFNSPWLNKKYLNTISHIPISNGEGNFFITMQEKAALNLQGQIFSVYKSAFANEFLPDYETVNLTGSKYGIEGIISQDGLILGRMGHPERINNHLYQNINFVQGDNIFANAVSYIKSKDS